MISFKCFRCFLASACCLAHYCVRTFLVPGRLALRSVAHGNHCNIVVTSHRLSCVMNVSIITHVFEVASK